MRDPAWCVLCESRLLRSPCSYGGEGLSDFGETGSGNLMRRYVRLVRLRTLRRRRVRFSVCRDGRLDGGCSPCNGDYRQRDRRAVY